MKKDRIKPKKLFKKNKLFSIPVICALIFFAAVGAYLTFFSQAATAGFYFKPASNSFTKGDTFSVQVRLNHPSAVDTLQTYINYPSNLELVGAPTVVEPYETDFENNTATSGLIKIQRSDFSDNLPTGDRIVSTIKFRAKSAGAATVYFTGDTYGVNQGSKQSIATTSATYTIANPASSQIPATPTSPSTETNSPATETPSSNQQTGSNTSPTSQPTSDSGSPATPSGPSENSRPSAAVDNGTAIRPGESFATTQESTLTSESGKNKLIPAVIIGAFFVPLIAAVELLLRRKGYNGIYGYLSSLGKSDAAGVADTKTSPASSLPANQPTVYKPQTPPPDAHPSGNKKKTL